MSQDYGSVYGNRWLERLNSLKTKACRGCETQMDGEREGGRPPAWTSLKKGLLRGVAPQLDRPEGWHESRPRKQPSKGVTKKISGYFSTLINNPEDYKKWPGDTWGSQAHLPRGSVPGPCTGTGQGNPATCVYRYITEHTVVWSDSTEIFRELFMHHTQQLE